jgi:hypothetical protein
MGSVFHDFSHGLIAKLSFYYTSAVSIKQPTQRRMTRIVRVIIRIYLPVAGLDATALDLINLRGIVILDQSNIPVENRQSF